MSGPAQRIGDPVVWHDAENGAYAVDIDLWERFAREGNGPVLDLGSGTGRVSLPLARRGLDVIALDREEVLLAALRERASAFGVEVDTRAGDARDLSIRDRDVATVLAPMQFAHLLGGEAGRRRLLLSAGMLVGAGGRVHLAILDDHALIPDGSPEPLPDVREVDGWVHSSLPTQIAVGEHGIEIHRLRQLVSPDGELSEEQDVIVLDHLGVGQLEAEALGLGFDVLERTPIPPTDDHVGSVVVSLEVPR